MGLIKLRPVLLVALVACTGCSLGKGERWKFASWDVRRAVGLKSDGKPDPEVPVRLVSTWTEAVHHRAGQKSERGFGGRLSFFKNGSQDPVRVHGQLVVYAFDETNRKDYETQPTRRYVFPAEQFAIHESGNELGASYSVWLPWDEIGGPQRKVSLIAKFEPKGGAAVVGEQTKHYLAGPPKPTLPATRGTDAGEVLESSSVDQVAHLEAVPGEGCAVENANLTVVELPPSVDQHAEATPQSRKRSLLDAFISPADEDGGEEAQPHNWNLVR